ncbi:dynamin family protein [Priestia aryabhattai]|uniref:Dynamin family protein n=1 Tax=Priestia aryabhattai TaxID=412384 RepID=A0ABD7WZA7_PRIAR|nr:dynamin family protein [Priestia aryabhattai]WEA45437.1 dynamin family protein [Priestia aryabhattai]
MTKIFIKYNPYKVETNITFEDRELTNESIMSQFKYERFQVWIEQLVPILANEVLNDAVFKIIFHGTTPDYEDLVEVCQYHNDVDGMDITIEHVKAKETEDKISELEKLVQHMQEGLFEELRDKKIQRNFDKAINSEFEIAVIATMSSGKSTLINSILGTELMPSKNEACTATIAQIKNVDGFEGFVGACYDKEENEIIPEQPITSEDIAVYNENENVSLIKMAGDIPNIHSHKMNLVLVDTPGPNNSMNSAHRDHTYRVIKNDSKPMVLYVLNGTQLHTDDDKALLTAVAEQMRVGGKQSKDRFIFAVNKVDNFDPEKGEDVGGVLKNVEMYLRDHGIMDPNIYPVSAELAKVIRKHQSGSRLTRVQRKVLQNYDLFTEEPSMHLNQYNPLSPSAKKQIQLKIDEARSKDDEYTEALYHSGVPAIEAAINEYLEKYAVTSKISNALYSFQKIIEEQQMVQSLIEEFSHNQDERQKMNEQMKRLKEIIQNGEKGTELKEKVLNLRVDVKKDIVKVQAKIQTQLTDISIEFGESQIKKEEAAEKITKCRKIVETLQSDVLTDLEQTIKNYIISHARKFIEEYKSYVAELVDMTTMEDLKFDPFKLFASSIPNVNEIISSHVYLKNEVVGTEKVKNENRKVYKPWTLFQKKFIEKEIYADVEYVNAEDLLEEFIAPIKQHLEENIDGAIEHLKKENQELKNFFIKEVEKLEEILKEKAEKYEKMSQDTEDLSAKIEQNKVKQEWLKNLITRIEQVLDI